MDKLTTKQQLFIKEYLIDFNGGRAYKTAFNREKIDNSCYVLAHGLLRNIKIQEQLSKEIAERMNKVDISVEYVLSNLKELVERCMQQIPVLDNDGKETGEWKFDSAGANSALDKLGKYFKMWMHNNQVNVNIVNYVDWVKGDGERSGVRKNETRP